MENFFGRYGVDRGEEFSDSDAFGGDGADDGASGRFGVDFALDAVGAGMVGFVDHEDVGDLHDAGFDRLDVVAHAGHEHHHRHRRELAISISSWPTPTVSMRT